MAYHHGNLRAELLDAAAETIAAGGVEGLSLRDLARRVGVSHAAPAHWFGDRAGLLTAVAADGFARLADDLEAAAAPGGGLLEAGIAYVRFATADRGRFDVMFRPGLLRGDDPDLRAAQERAAAELRSAAAGVPGDAGTAGLAAWSLVHGLATLWNSGAVQDDAPVEEVARRVASVLAPPGPAPAGGDR
ncbi:TetR/AcrR family transcriptional regulator [Agromyces seonyuensis]|uniref:TetR family transcriptional regulator n=1 Tax=Agromyces seonyuensis TaxID=2662446 RepID=A0A6I4P095_9MICO|nr:TetR/AcrR family transcriptional regulator [Agromyces seonyuensis]MWB98912.1 TetR family transcriptional regulator [Agromyces seonyuensis]